MTDRMPFRQALPWVAAVFLLKLAVQIAFADGYGWFRDEFYYLACADRLSWSYVDHPPLSVVLLKAWRALVGDELVALRILPALVGAAGVGLTAALAWWFGARRLGIVTAGLVALTTPVYLAVHHIVSMNAFETLVWGAAGWLFLDALHTRRRSRWIGLGCVLALGLLNKISVLWLGTGLALAILVTPHRATLRTAGPWIAAGIAMLGLIPNVVWNLAHDLATLEFMVNAVGSKMVDVSPLEFLSGQARTLGPSAPWAVLGLVALAIRPRTRPLAIVYAVVLAILITSGAARSGYLAPAYVWAFAAAGAFLDDVWSRWPRVVPALVLASVMVLGALAAPFAVPVLPVDEYMDYARGAGIEPSTSERKELAELPQWFADMHGWDDMVDAVADAVDRLPLGDRARAGILTMNYGQAGALQRLGRDRDLPPVMSNHNHYWIWGPAPGWDGEVALVLGSSRSFLERHYRSVVEWGRVRCERCMPYENDNPIWLARSLRRPLAETWEAIGHYD